MRFFVFDTDTPCPYGGGGACVDVPRKDGGEERQKCMKCKKIQTGFRQSKYKIHKLHEKNYAKPDTLGRMRTNTARLFEYIEQNPVIEMQKTADSLGLSYNTAAVIKNLCNLGILEKSKSVSRSKTFAYTAYLDILKKRTE